MKKIIDIIPDFPTKNGRVYSEEALTKAFNEFMLSSGVQYITTEPPDSDSFAVNMRKVIGVIDGIEKKDSFYEADIRILYNKELNEELIKNSSLMPAFVGFDDGAGVSIQTTICFYIRPK